MHYPYKIVGLYTEDNKLETLAASASRENALKIAISLEQVDLLGTENSFQFDRIGVLDTTVTPHQLLVNDTKGGLCL